MSGVWPVFDEEQQAAVQRVLESGRVNYWTGPEGRAFEAEFAARFGARHAIALGNGTLALDLALRAVGVTAGDEVIVTPRSFMASASCVALLGATPVFVDVHPDSQNMTLAGVEQALTPRTKAILPVHLAGWPCDMDGIMALADRHGLAVIEDCAQAHGAAINGQSVGSFGTAAAYSFCQDKIMTTGGEGGMLLTDSEAVYRWAWAFKDHGKSSAKMNAGNGSREFRYVHDSIGSNYRMTEMQAAIGRVQLRRLDNWLEIRHRNAGLWRESLADLAALRLPQPGPGVKHAYYKFYAFLVPEALRPDWSRARILQEANDAGVACFSGSCPEIYRETAFADDDRAPLPVAKRLGETSLMLLVDPTLDENRIRVDAEKLRAVIDRATA